VGWRLMAAVYLGLAAAAGIETIVLILTGGL